RSFRWNLTASAARPNPQGSFHYGTIQTSRTLVLASSAARPDGGAPRPGTPVVRLNLHEFVEVVFQNTENEMQSWHLDGYDFWVVGYGDNGQWTEN
uniref:Plastocyanin-like domain-containing protein n=1 Tax=Aegilops tauschii subsp. strangulata TaxID=200361 RepID=A0A453BP28_AEGTS